MPSRKYAITTKKSAHCRATFSWTASATATSSTVHSSLITSVSRQKQVSTLRLLGHRDPENQPLSVFCSALPHRKMETFSMTEDLCLAWNSTVFDVKLARFCRVTLCSVHRSMEAIAGGAVIQEDQAWHAAELAGLADDISAMPMGMQTMIPDGGGTLRDSAKGLRLRERWSDNRVC